MGQLNMEVIIGVDTNAHSAAWYHNSNNGEAMSKGRQVMSLVE